MDLSVERLLIQHGWKNALVRYVEKAPSEPREPVEAEGMNVVADAGVAGAVSSLESEAPFRVTRT